MKYFATGIFCLIVGAVLTVAFYEKRPVETEPVYLVSDFFEAEIIDTNEDGTASIQNHQGKVFTQPIFFEDVTDPLFLEYVTEPDTSGLAVFSGLYVLQGDSITNIGLLSWGRTCDHTERLLGDISFGFYDHNNNLTGIVSGSCYRDRGTIVSVDMNTNIMQMKWTDPLRNKYPAREYSLIGKQTPAEDTEPWLWLIQRPGKSTRDALLIAES